MKKKIRHQTRLVGQTRTPMSTCVISEIEECVRADMRMFNVSRSFVIATHLAHAYGIKVEDYRRLRLLKKA